MPAKCYDPTFYNAIIDSVHESHMTRVGLLSQQVARDIEGQVLRLRQKSLQPLIQYLCKHENGANVVLEKVFTDFGIAIPHGISQTQAAAFFHCACIHYRKDPLQIVADILAVEDSSSSDSTSENDSGNELQQLKRRFEQLERRVLIVQAPTLDPDPVVADSDKRLVWAQYMPDPTSNEGPCWVIWDS